MHYNELCSTDVPSENQFWRGLDQEPSDSIRRKIELEVKNIRKIKPENDYRPGPLAPLSASPKKRRESILFTSALHRLDNITCEEEKRLDAIDYRRHKQEVESRFTRNHEAKKRRLTHKSCDDEVFRELYDNFGGDLAS